MHIKILNSKTGGYISWRRTPGLKVVFYITDVDGKEVYLILQRVLGTPLEMAPAKARCSNGDRWYLVVPLI
jgi:hypothetical protein